MASIDEIRQARLEKLNKFKDKGVKAYPVSSEKDFTNKKTSEDFDEISKNGENINLAGRVMSFRAQGALAFFNFDDGTALFQGMIKKDDVGEDEFKFFVDMVDVGDFIQLTGSLFVTKTNQKTILVLKWKMLSKSLRPLPEKWHGLQDVEERFRKRYLDTLMSPEVKARFIARSKVVSEIRRILNENDFLEVETPMLEHLAGGASAEPFVTHHNTLDIDLYMRIAPELHLKRLLIGGFPKVYELGKSFRNEGIDMTHNPEFTTVEFYESYTDSRKLMVFVEKILKEVVEKVTGKSVVVFEEQEIDFSKDFEIISYFDLLKKYAFINNPESITFDELGSEASKLDVRVEKGDTIEKLMDKIYKKHCRPKLIQPTFIVNYPVNYLPLAKRLEDNLELVDAFQIVIAGTELVKAFSELNDPIDQRERFSEQEKNKESGDKEAQPMDEEFLEAMEYGMPPAGGLGMSIDRLTMILTDTRNIREVILFPTLRPKN